jgi:hypothetical protein
MFLKTHLFDINRFENSKKKQHALEASKIANRRSIAKRRQVARGIRIAGVSSLSVSPLLMSTTTKGTRARLAMPRAFTTRLADA